MPLSLFGYDPKRHAQDCIGRSDEFGHTFGGTFEEFSLEVVGAPAPLHLIYRINLADPKVPLAREDLQWLPLCYGCNYGYECSYRVVSDHRIEVLEPRVGDHLVPVWDPPASFPLADTAFKAQPYDPTVAEDALRWKGVFGWDELSRSELDRALQIVQASRCHLSIDDAPDDDWTYEDVIRCMYDPPFVQAKPSQGCLCGSESTSVIAVQNEAIAAELLWPDCGVQTIWQMCDVCGCINTSNQCT